jgi:hypothetical protein
VHWHIPEYLRYLDSPRQTVGAALDHAGLAPAPALLDAAAAELSRPTYYTSPLGPEEIETVRSITSDVAARFGY